VIDSALSLLLRTFCCPGHFFALSITNVLGNKIGQQQRAKPQEVMRGKPKLISFCGVAHDATGADFSGLDMDSDGAIILASELPDKVALSSLNLASDCLCGFDKWGNGTFNASGISKAAFVLFFITHSLAHT
jgi:hypothetical protein